MAWTCDACKREVPARELTCECGCSSATSEWGKRSIPGPPRFDCCDERDAELESLRAALAASESDPRTTRVAELTTELTHAISSARKLAAELESEREKRRVAEGERDEARRQLAANSEGR